jgi:hypothetical protein
MFIEDGSKPWFLGLFNGFRRPSTGDRPPPQRSREAAVLLLRRKRPGSASDFKKNHWVPDVWLLKNRNRTSWFRTFSKFVRAGFVCKECPDSCSLVETNRACCDLVYPETSWGVAMQQWHSDTNCRIMRRELCLIPINAPILWFSRAKHYHYHLGLWRIGRFTESDSCESQG